MTSIGTIPFISIDQEGGNVLIIMEKSTFYPVPMIISATNKQNANKVGHMMGKHLLSLWINMNFVHH